MTAIMTNENLCTSMYNNIIGKIESFYEDDKTYYKYSIDTIVSHAEIFNNAPISIRSNYYSTELLNGFMKYFCEVLNNFDNNESATIDALTNLTDFLEQKPTKNTDNFMKQHKDNIFTTELFAEFLIRNSDPKQSLTDDEVKSLIKYHSDNIVNSEMLTTALNIEHDMYTESDLYLNKILQYCIPFFSDFHNVIYILDDLYFQDGNTFIDGSITRDSIRMLNNYVSYITTKVSEYNTIAEDDIKICDYRPENNVFKGFYNLNGNYVFNNNNRFHVEAFLYCCTTVKEFRQTKLIDIYNFMCHVEPKCNNLTFVQGLFNDFITGDFKTDAILINDDQYNKIIQFIDNSNDPIVKNHNNINDVGKDILYKSYAMHILSECIDTIDGKNFDDYYKMLCTVYFNDGENYLWDKYFAYNNIVNVILYKLLKHYTVVELRDFLKSISQQNIVMNIDKWANYINNIEEYKELPVSWVLELV